MLRRRSWRVTSHKEHGRLIMGCQDKGRAGAKLYMIGVRMVTGPGEYPQIVVIIASVCSSVTIPR